MADETEYTESDIWASPTQKAPPEPRPETPKTPKTPRTPAAHDRKPDPADHEAALRKELEGVRNINETIGSVLATLERAGGNMETVGGTVTNASTLLNTWTRILSQTEHNQRLLLHPGWKGATEDMAEQEAEAIHRQQAAERRAAEEEQRREDARRRREDEENRRRLGGPTGTRGSRGTTGTRATRSRGRAGARGATGSSYSSEGTATGSRAGSNIGRGFGASRSRARGTR